MVANTKGYHVKILSISVPAFQFPCIEANNVVHFLCVLCRELYADTTQNHMHISYLPLCTHMVLFWNIVLHLGLFTRQLILVINPYPS